MNSRLLTALILTVLLATFSASRNAWAVAGEYSLRVKAGPSFQLADYENQLKIGGEFDYELGYGFGFNLGTFFGISDSFLFQMIPAVKYDLLYMVPGSIHVLAGAGYQSFDADGALGMRFGVGLELPLARPWEFMTDINIFTTPTGTEGNPTTFDWLIGFGMRY